MTAQKSAVTADEPHNAAPGASMMTSSLPVTRTVCQSAYSAKLFTDADRAPRQIDVGPCQRQQLAFTAVGGRPPHHPERTPSAGTKRQISSPSRTCRRSSQLGATTQMSRRLCAAFGTVGTLSSRRCVSRTAGGYRRAEVVERWAGPAGPKFPAICSARWYRGPLGPRVTPCATTPRRAVRVPAGW